MSYIVAIDGPSGTGKGTITKLIAKEMGLLNIDTGAMYRCIALACLEKGINSKEQETQIVQIAQNSHISLIHEQDELKVFLDGKDVTEKIRTKEVTTFTSPMSAIPKVREIMVKLQREMAKGKDIIMEGRDIATEVFPNANVKIYLDATPEERAKRRFKENQEKGSKVSYEETLQMMKQRDYNDTHRPVGALKIAEGAIKIDTTHMTIDDVKEKVKEIILQNRTGY